MSAMGFGNQEQERFDEFESETRVTVGLPPDPDDQNISRAISAGEALREFVANSGSDPQDALVDLLCNLRHWCDRHGQDFEDAMSRSDSIYMDEINGQPMDGSIPLPPRPEIKPPTKSVFDNVPM